MLLARVNARKCNINKNSPVRMRRTVYSAHINYLRASFCRELGIAALKMYFSVLFLACLTPAVMGVIVNLDSDPAVEQIQPLEVDLTPGQDLIELAESVLGATF